MNEKSGGKIIIDTRCGLNCSTCGFMKTGECGGCIATKGRPFHGECSLAACCQDKEYFHCGLCPDFPCKRLDDYSYDPVHGDDGKRIVNLRKWAVL